MGQDKPDTDLREAVLKLIENSHHLVTKKEIAKVLGVKGARRRELKHILANLKAEGYGAKIVKRIRPPEANNADSKKRLPRPHNELHLGLFKTGRFGGQLVPCHRKDPFPGVSCNPEIAAKLNEGDVVLYHANRARGVEIERVLGSIDNPKIFSLMAIHAHQLPFEFDQDAIDLANNGKIPPLGNRTDFRDLPLVTIDGEDARDFDDAVWATPDPDPRNEGGWRIIVAIADVSYYVRPSDALDKEAYERGNSVYFPDRVVPMLPEALSNGLCSLRPDEDRGCLAVEMIISSNGKLKSHRFKRGLMRSKARLTYNQVQRAIEGDFDNTTEPLWEEVLSPLYGAYQSLLKARKSRGTLDLNIPEHQVVFHEDGSVKNIVLRTHQESHQLIEELMIAANVAAAKTLLVKNWPTLFRVHDTPDSVRVDNLKMFLKSFKIEIPKTKTFNPLHFNQILKATTGSPHMRFIHDLVLRSQSQAKYAPTNIGHFGLSLAHYCHFTSPIRRYADLVVHRSLIASLGLGDDGQEPLPLEVLEMIGDHISSTERLASSAEREVMDRFHAAYLENQVGKDFHATIVGVSTAGIFVGLSETGAQGFIAKSHLPGDYFIFDEHQHRYIGSRTKTVYQLGQPINVILTSSDPVTCSITFSLIEEMKPRGYPKKSLEHNENRHHHHYQKSKKERKSPSQKEEPHKEKHIRRKRSKDLKPSLL
ncbi:MAG: ribonuclease R [Alphaproteobacteria bacterium]|nr:ribonuclease R [Alphaproteobacteria bacterium]